MSAGTTLGNEIQLYPIQDPGPNVQITSLTQPAHGNVDDFEATSFDYNPPPGDCNDVSSPDDVVLQLTNGTQTGPVTVHMIVDC